MIKPLSDLTKPQLEALVKLAVANGRWLKPSDRNHKHYMALWRAGYAAASHNANPSMFQLNVRERRAVEIAVGLLPS